MYYIYINHFLYKNTLPKQNIVYYINTVDIKYFVIANTNVNLTAFNYHVFTMDTSL